MNTINTRGNLKPNHQSHIFVKFGTGNEDIIQGLNSLQFNSRADKTTHLVAALRSYSQSNQANAVAILRSQFSQVTFKQFYTSNEIFVEGANSKIIRELEALPEVTEIREELLIEYDYGFAVEGGVQPQSQAEWNLEKIEAPKAWALPGGNKGEGVVVAHIDTGVRHTHEILRGNYRSDYSWYDICSGDTREPIDEGGHGTMTMGILAGAGLGVAPGAQWITCRGLCPRTESGVGTESRVKACAEWVLCPTLPDGTNEDCSKAPNVVSNSYVGPADHSFMDNVIEAWKAVDIIPVFALGNGGPNCSTGSSPGDRATIGVGSTNRDDMLSSFSSRGPAANNVMKPDITAPGNSIKSPYNNADDGYVLAGGTSMACPHVAGTVALLLSRRPTLNYNQVRGILFQTRDSSGLGDTGAVCGGRNSTVFPNNFYGHGRLNARMALAVLIIGQETG